MTYDHAFSPLPKFYPWDTPQFWATLFQQYLCETSTDKNLSGDPSDVSEENSLEISRRMQQLKEYDTNPPTDELSNGLRRLEMRSRIKKVARPTGARISVDAVVDRLYTVFSKDMKRLAEIERQENVGS